MNAKNTKTPTWRQRAACRGVDPDIFYPVSDEEAEDAKAICAQCPSLLFKPMRMRPRQSWPKSVCG